MKRRELNNGYTLIKDDWSSRWEIYSPNGLHYMTCISYEEAYKLASHLVKEAN